MKKIIALISFFISASAFSADFGLSINFHGQDLPYFGITAEWLKGALTQALAANGHSVIERGKNQNTPYIQMEFNGFSDNGFDGGRTLLGKSEGVILFVEPLTLAPDGKNKKGKVIWAITKYRLCTGMATDDRRSAIQQGFLKCINNFVNN